MSTQKDVKPLHPTEQSCQLTTSYVSVRNLQGNCPSSALACQLLLAQAHRARRSQPVYFRSLQLLTRPCHSIVNQAFGSRLRLDPRRPINGDGFGVGWYDSVYDEELGVQPCIFTSSTPVSDTFSSGFKPLPTPFDILLRYADTVAWFRLGITQTSYD